MKLKPLLFCFFIFFLNTLLFSQQIVLPPDNKKTLIEDLPDSPKEPAKKKDGDKGESVVKDGEKNDVSKDKATKGNDEQQDSAKDKKQVLTEESREEEKDGKKDGVDLKPKEATEKVKTTTRTITINSARSTEYKKVKAKKKRKT